MILAATYRIRLSDWISPPDSRTRLHLDTTQLDTTQTAVDRFPPEASSFVLRLAIQLDLKFPDVARGCQTHRQSPPLSSFTSTPEVRALSSPGVTRPHRPYSPFPPPDCPSPLPPTFG